ncbi:sigma-70 family RNA polymerase sigma factor [Methylobacillus caricis]|uniref:sigma-70 family RNA polymerase sigma factor n=1 Tax=Methylobacillus caricis TaxID=1971611 RepID=UPI001CFF8049|nr:sigma-70 family RNA polymerase sigma factor [Methylobacillus caricis]MCB5187932.1 sigma-70 family RNA polymerase sigma factor [Methylobacillus caricis]
MMLNPTWHGIDLRWAYMDLLPTIYRQTSYRRSAYDILHDALIRFAISTNPDRLQQPHAYLHTIVRNLLIDNHKEQARFIPLVTEDIESELAYELDQPRVPSAEHLVDIQQRLDILQKIIDHLPPRCKETFWLYRIEGMAQQDIADKLGISLNMVQRHIMRAMLDLLEAKDLIS